MAANKYLERPMGRIYKERSLSGFRQTSQQAAASMIAKRILHSFTMGYIMFGMLYFYMISDFHLELWYSSNTYYIYAKGMDFFIILCCCVPLKEFLRGWICIGAFFVVRCLWEVLAIKDYASASRPSIIFILFLSDLVCLLLIMIMHIRNNRK